MVVAYTVTLIQKGRRIYKIGASFRPDVHLSAFPSSVRAHSMLHKIW